MGHVELIMRIDQKFFKHHMWKKTASPDKLCLALISPDLLRLLVKYLE